MKTKLLPGLCLIILLIFNPLPAFTQQQTIDLTADELVRMAISNIETNDKLKRAYLSFERTETEYDLDRSGRCKRVNNANLCISVLNRRTTYHGNAYPETIRGGSRESEFSINLNKILLSSYTYSFIDLKDPANATIADDFGFECNNCLVIRFVPKAILPDITEITSPNMSLKDIGIHETAMRMNGVIYIDKTHLFLRKHIGKLDESFSKYGAAVQVTIGSIDIEQTLQSDLDNLIIIKSAQIIYQIRKAWGFLGYETRKLVWEYDEYRLNP